MKKEHRFSFRQQLTVSLLGCLLVSAIMILVCLTLNITEAARSSRSYLDRLNEQWDTELESIVEGIEQLRFLHLFSSEVMQAVSADEKSVEEEAILEQETYLSRLLGTICSVNPNMLRITLETENGRLFGNYVENSRASVALARQHFLYEGKDAAKMRVTDVYRGEINLVPYSLLTFWYPLYRVSDGERLGNVYIDLDYEALQERFDRVERQEGWVSCILNRNGVIYASDPQLTEQADEQQWKALKTAGASQKEGIWQKLGGTDYLLCVRYVDELDWYLIQGVQSSSLLFGNMRGVLLLSFWVALLLCGLLCAGWLLMRRISAPIGELSRVMSQAAIDDRKELVYMNCRKDYPAEICEIAQGYNAMLDRIHENIIREYDNALAQKQTELQMLQYQINPHFLYNTLNIMSSIARLYEIPYISDISESLSRMFHYNVKGGQTATLGQELDNLENYLRIQKIRFPGKIQVTYVIPEDLRGCVMLKFLLQPLAENAVDHGIREKTGEGRITISACRKNGDVEVVIADDGVGISREKCRELCQRLEGGGAEHGQGEAGIGILNVHTRVRKYYGEGYGITLESEEGSGTRVYLLFPLHITDSAAGGGFPLKTEKEGGSDRHEDHCGGR